MPSSAFVPARRTTIGLGSSSNRAIASLITRGDEVAQGINDAIARFDELPKPIVVRLAGTNAEEGMEILNVDALDVEETLEGAVQRAVELAGAAGGDGGEDG